MRIHVFTLAEVSVEIPVDLTHEDDEEEALNFAYERAKEWADQYHRAGEGVTIYVNEEFQLKDPQIEREE